MRGHTITVASVDDRDGDDGVPSTLRIALDADGLLPTSDPDAYDVFLSAHPTPPRPWVAVADVERAAAELARAANAHADAVTVLLEVLRVTEALPLAAALTVESLGYSTLLGGQDFREWLARRPASTARLPLAQPLRVEREADLVTLTLADPARLNAYSSAMRDSLAYALDSCLVDPTRPAVVLRGAGRAFCAGGALDDFGRARDLAEAHRVRLAQSAVLRIATLGARASAVVHGAVVGSGIEIAAATARVVARRDAWFWLPELAMGLIPGAGGTATIARRVGRHRAAYLMLSGVRLAVGDALAWGLVDEVVPS
jgi:enoyl-CoA hydratase/carnithine racemase